MPTTCLDTIIGLDTTACDCFQADAPVDYSVSDSGLYLTDPEFGLPIRDAILASADCTDSGIWSVMETARSQGIRDFKADLQAALHAKRERTFIPWRGMVGKIEMNGRHAIASTYAGQIWRPVDRKPGRRFVVTAVWAGFDSTGTVNATITTNAYGVADIPLSLNTQAMQWTRNELETPATLEMYDTGEVELYHAFLYDPAGLRVLSNRLHCCGAPSWSKNAIVAGVTINDLALLRDFHGRGNAGYGLAVEGYFDCDDLGWLCDLRQLGGESFYQYVAHAILAKSTIKLISKLMDGGQINQYTLLEYDNANQRRVALADKYASLLDWLVYEMPTGFSGCWGCRKSDFKTSKLMS